MSVYMATNTKVSIHWLVGGTQKYSHDMFSLTLHFVAHKYPKRLHERFNKHTPLLLKTVISTGQLLSLGKQPIDQG